MEVKLLKYPTEEDWMGCKQRICITVGKHPVTPPSLEWKIERLRNRHSPVRYLQFSFELVIPYWLSTEFSRHVHAQPYIKSQRNDRQQEYDRNAARQDAPVTMIWDLNAEELMTVANKRLCGKASKEAREVVGKMCSLVNDVCPEFRSFLVPYCAANGWYCPEGAMSCGYNMGWWSTLKIEDCKCEHVEYMCSNCFTLVKEATPFCPHCGRPMLDLEDKHERNP